MRFLILLCFLIIPDQGYIIAGIILQETHAGKLGRIGDDNKSFGVCQMQLKTAQEVIRKHFKYKLYNDQQLREKLITDDKFAIILCRIYVSQLINYFKGNVDKAILSYNVGFGNFNKHGFKFDPNDYLRKVKRYSKMINNKDK